MEKYYLYVSLSNWKLDNNPAAWSVLRDAVSPRYSKGLTDDNLAIALAQGKSVEICFNDSVEQLEKAVASLASRFPGRYILRTDKK